MERDIVDGVYVDGAVHDRVSVALEGEIGTGETKRKKTKKRDISFVSFFLCVLFLFISSFLLKKKKKSNTIRSRTKARTRLQIKQKRT